jgi:hypothetical protein
MIAASRAISSRGRASADVCGCLLAGSAAGLTNFASRIAPHEIHLTNLFLAIQRRDYLVQSYRDIEINYEKEFHLRV